MELGKMNKVQSDYMEAKALVDALEERMKGMEQAYIAAHNIRNPDGSVPGRIYCILDMKVFDKANVESASEMAACGLEAEYNAAQSALKAAEDRLIEYGLSLVPTDIQAVLKENERDYATRMKMIDLVFNLDVSTVPAELSTQDAH